MRVIQQVIQQVANNHKLNTYESPSQSWNLIWPFDVVAVKSGNTSPRFTIFSQSETI